jgi:hypothetical protein
MVSMDERVGCRAGLCLLSASGWPDGNDSIWPLAFAAQIRPEGILLARSLRDDAIARSFGKASKVSWLKSLGASLRMLWKHA